MSKRIKVVSIGSGNVANHLIPAMKNIGCEITQVYSQTLKNARSLARKVGAKGIDNIANLDMESDFYLLMISDDHIDSVIKQLPHFDKYKYLAHTSGSNSSEGLRSKAANFGSFYPLQSFKKNKKLNLQNVPFLLYGNNDKTLKFFRVLARQISPIVQKVNDKERSKYHFAAVLMNNFVNHLACITDNYLSENKLDPKILKPIINSTFENILTKNPCDIQTGPAVRNDTKLQRKHLELLKDDKEMTAIYKSMSKSISNKNKFK